MACADGSLEMSHERHVLVVAGSDSSGGAGVARDVETIGHFGLRSCLAITAVTVQTHDAVVDVQHMLTSLVVEQMRAALVSNPVAAIKIGMLGRGETVQAVAGVLTTHAQGLPIVLDPVLVSSSGRVLLDIDALGVLLSSLLPLSTMVTPNIPELAQLTGTPIAENRTDLLLQAERLIECGAKSVLIKGGHWEGALATDILMHADGSVEDFAAPRSKGTMRGTGCMISSAIAAGFAQGNSVSKAVARAKAYIGMKFQQR